MPRTDVPGEAATLELSRAYQALARAAAAPAPESRGRLPGEPLRVLGVGWIGLDLKQRERDHKAKARTRSRVAERGAEPGRRRRGWGRGWFAVLETARLVEARRALAGETSPASRTVTRRER